MPAETARRYMTRGRPPTFFVASISRALKAPLEWLVFGVEGCAATEGSVRAAQHALLDDVKGDSKQDRNAAEGGSMPHGVSPANTPRLSGSR